MSDFAEMLGFNLLSMRCGVFLLAAQAALWHGGQRRIMPKHLFNWRHDKFTSLLLVVLLFRAYVPVGFMPASGTPFLLELCPATYQVQMPAHHGHHHSGTHTHFENCPFGSAPAAGPIAHIVAFAPPAPIVAQPIVAFESLRLGVQLPRAHQPRGPPLSRLN